MEKKYLLRKGNTVLLLRSGIIVKTGTRTTDCRFFHNHLPPPLFSFVVCNAAGAESRKGAVADGSRREAGVVFFQKNCILLLLLRQDF